MQDEDKAIADALAQQWGLTVTAGFSKEEIIENLALKLASVIEKGPEPFFQLMYRLDIPEKKLNQAMYDKNAVHEIAELVYNRQLQKMRSRQFYKPGKPGDDSLSW